MVNIAIVGAGFMGTTHLNAYQMMQNVNVTAICNSGEEKGKALAQKAGCPWYGDFGAMLKDESIRIDLVDICVPTYLHKEYAVMAANAGKHIICEKPAALSLEDYLQMKNAAEAAGVSLNIGHVIRYWPEYVYAEKLYRQGAFGDLKYARATRMACVSKRARDGGWFIRPDLSGGGLLDLHIHDVDYFCHLFGKVRSVYSVGSKNRAGSWNYVCTSLNFENGLQAVAEGISEMPHGFPFTMELNIVGENKALCYKLGSGENLYDMSSTGRVTRIYDCEDDPQTVGTDTTDAYYLELKDFVEHIELGTPVETITDADVIHTMKVMEAVKQSLEEHREVMV